jgi:periplasmic divalent cation tolerance protein
MHIAVFITAAHKKEADRIARELIKNRVVACVNIIDKIESLFWWQGKVERSKEVLLIIKSRKEKLAKIIKIVKSIHSYEVPEIIAFAIIGGDKRYLKWIDESLR